MAQHRELHETPQQAAEGTGSPSPNRFSRLPERIRPEDTVETKPATLPDPARDQYNADEWLVRYCL
ncbi:hypothetical protein J2Z21_005234 [Streptomyces griseochromogenes]|uniref:Uncharacterized protein n=1 Tax=Streptomyces griseochromogenes TaxID=68214 RepID=A0A1B1AWD3_9ACTN|nr:hypothetical protein [Streptomyces griseochromogenes]ANP50855.1 hypothetical protein AVL59_15580 [Streptomyces griseochromogenes]MBP2052252.1 hypothetical protein [Streptomyces griseochromogenes]